MGKHSPHFPTYDAMWFVRCAFLPAIVVGMAAWMIAEPFVPRVARGVRGGVRFVKWVWNPDADRWE